MATRILYISGSAGLGHVTRDLAVAQELRRLEPEVEIAWLAGGPALDVLRQAGESVLPESRRYADVTAVAEEIADHHGTVLDYAVKAMRVEAREAPAIARLANERGFDVVVADEAYALTIHLSRHRDRLRCPYVMMIDFLGADAISRGPKETVMAWGFNFTWRRWDRRLFRDGRNLCLFVGEAEDVPDRGLGLGLPNRRRHAEAHYTFLGYVLPFHPSEYSDRAAVRRRLGYDERPLIVVSIGGTAIGRELLELSARAFPLIKRRLPDARMVLVCGPNIPPPSVEAGEGVELRGFVPDLYEHFAACDLAITQGGGTSTLELTALRRPFLYFPLERHFEQEQVVAPRVARHGAGVRMTRSRTGPDELAAAVLSHIGEEAGYPPIPVDGAAKAARLILSLAARGT